MQKVLGKLKILFITSAVILSFSILLVPISALNGYITVEETQQSYSTIPEAVAAASEGDTIILKAGVYDIDAAISISKSLTIKGEGSKDTIIKASDSYVPGYMFVFGGSDKAFYLEGLSVIGKADNSGSGIKIASTTKVNTVSIKDCRFEKLNIGIYNGDNYVTEGYTTNVNIENSYFSCGLVGSYFERVKNVNIKNNVFVQSSRSGFQICAPLNSNNTIESISVVGNRFENIGAFAFVLDILKTTRLQSLTIQNNVSTNVGGGEFERLHTYRYRITDQNNLPASQVVSNNGSLKEMLTLATETGSVYQPVIETKDVVEGIVQIPYQQSIKVDSSTNGTLSYALKEGSVLPQGLELKNTGELTGIPTKAGKYTFTVKVSNEAGSDEKEFTINIADSISIDIPTIETGKDVENIEVGINDSTSKEKLAQYVGAILKDVIQDKNINSLSPATIAAVQKALEDNHMIDSKVVIEKITENDIEVSDKKRIEDKLLSLTNDKGTIEQYFDLSVQLWANQNKLGEVNELPDHIEFTMLLPQELLVSNREYFVLRMHEGEVDRLETTLDENGVLTFKTDRFSTYALAYTEKDDKADEENNNGVSNEKDSNVVGQKNTDNKETSALKKSTNTQNKQATAPKTSDESQIILYVAYAFSSLMICAIYILKKEVSRK